MSTFLSIVILNYNTRELLARCLHSVERCVPDAQVIVVDNASTDDSAALVSETFSSVRLIANSNNRGFARGMNQGLSEFTAPFVFALNADTELTPTTLPPLLAAATQLPRAGILAPTQIASDGAPLASAFPDPTLISEMMRLIFFRDHLAARFHRGAWRVRTGDIPERVNWLMGAALLFRRECLQSVGGFDETQFMYGEDWDICYRARQNNWRVYLVPAARIIHHTNVAGKQAFGASRQARVLEANLHFHAKHFGDASRRALAFLYLIGGLLRLPWLGALYLAQPAHLGWQSQIEEVRVAWRALARVR
ncbi:MAG: glycosyltransferase family 2 protein [Chloroflexi bacterium]|nr:glycosyltransferase family 2 protein [Chloroflexota bacterium]